MGKQRELWLVANVGDGAHPDDRPQDVVWPDRGWHGRPLEKEAYEPVGPWEPVSYNHGNRCFVWKRLYQEKSSDLQRLGAVQDDGRIADILRQLANLLEP